MGFSDSLIGSTEGIYRCEATGRLVKVCNISSDDFLTGRKRIFSSNDVAFDHKKLENIRGTYLAHIESIYSSQSYRSAKFSLSASEFIDLLESIREQGILRPILVCRSKEFLPYIYIVRSGFKRYEAARQLGLRHLPITVVDENITPRMTTLLEKTNFTSKPLEIALVLRSIMEEGKKAKNSDKRVRLSQKEVSLLTGMAQSTVSEYLKLLDCLCVEAKRKVSNNTLSLSKAVLLTKIPLEAQIECLPVADIVDYRTFKVYVNTKMDELGIPRKKDGRALRKRDVGGPYVIRSIDQIVSAMHLALVDYKKSATAKTKYRLQAYQYVLGVIPEFGSKPVKDLGIEKEVKSASKRSKSNPKKDF